MTKTFDDRFVAFVDVLGFRDLVQRMKNEPGQFQTVRDSLKEIQKQARSFKEYRASLNTRKPGRVYFLAKSQLQMTAFSDCFVLSEKRPAWHVLAAVQALGSRYLERGILTRGGVVHGGMYHSGAVAFGPALIAAYELEQRAAIYPRILVSERVRIECWGYHKGICKERLFIRDADGGWFVNVLAPPLSKWEALTTRHAELELTKFLSRVRDELARSWLRAGSDAAHRSKVGWLVNQYNLVAEQNGLEVLTLA